MDTLMLRYTLILAFFAAASASAPAASATPAASAASGAAPAGQFFHALQQQRAAVLCPAGANLVGAHPERSHDTGVQRAARLGFAQFTAKGESQVGDVLHRAGLGARSLEA